MDSHLDLLLESAVVKLETSMKKMERRARSADILVSWADGEMEAYTVAGF